MIEARYPHLTEWVRTHGLIELGQTDQTHSFIRVLDEGGIVWEGFEAVRDRYRCRSVREEELK
jgi:hypothetical protein